MRRLLGLLVVALVGAAIAALTIPSGENQTRVPPPKHDLAKDQPRCPRPRVTAVTARAVSDNGRRIALHVRARMERRGIGAFEVRWGNRSSLIADGWWGRRAAADFEHRYPEPGAYRMTVVAEGSTRGCKRLQKSEPATLRIRVPLTTSYPSSP
jgi:hypothetical protein